MITYINQLRVFYTVAKLKSLTRAAQALNVTPPAISRQLKVLEEMLELKLLYFEGKSFRLTDIGNEIFEQAQEVFEKLEELGEYIQDLSELKSGVLRVGFPQAIARYLIPPLIDLYRKNNPKVKIILYEGTSADLIDRVIDRKIHVAIVGLIPTDQKDKIKVIKAKKGGALALIASPTYPIAEKISIQEAAVHPLIFPQEGSAGRALTLKHFEKFKLKPSVILESSSIDLLKEMVAQGKGIAFIPKIAVHDELLNGRLKTIQLLEGEPEVERWFVYLKDRTLSPAANAFLEILDRIEEIEEKLW